VMRQAASRPRRRSGDAAERRVFPLPSRGCPLRTERTSPSRNGSADARKNRPSPGTLPTESFTGSEFPTPCSMWAGSDAEFGLTSSGFSGAASYSMKMESSFSIQSLTGMVRYSVFEVRITIFSMPALMICLLHIEQLIASLSSSLVRASRPTR